MKKSLLILTLLFTGFIHHISAQNLSVFYEPDSKNSNYKYDKKLG